MKKQQNILSNKVSVSVAHVVLILGFGLMLACPEAFAQAAGGDPLGDGVCKLVSTLTGKWLFGFTILATIGFGSALLFGAEMSDTMKKLATVITIVGLILSISSILAMAFQKFNGMTC